MVCEWGMDMYIFESYVHGPPIGCVVTNLNDDMNNK